MINVNHKHTMWVEKYRPTTMDDYLGNATIVETFRGYIESNEINHLLLHGDAGSGKTCAAKILANSIAPDNYIYINASDENSVDTVRDKIKQFASSVSFGGLKIIVLDEAEFISLSGQAALRNIMETFSQTTRFILTCNYVDKVIDPIQSRCQIFNIAPPSKKDIAMHLSTILRMESITFEPKELAAIVTANYPDIRRIINTAQRCSGTGTLVLDTETLLENNYYNSIIDILKSQTTTTSKYTNIRQIIADNFVRDYTKLFRYMYDNVDMYADGHTASVLLIIAEFMYKDSFVPDHEINAMAMFITIISELGAKK